MNPFNAGQQSKLCEFLRAHEDDIARNQGDFSLLHGAFHAMFQRNAEAESFGVWITHETITQLTPDTRAALERAYK